MINSIINGRLWNYKTVERKDMAWVRKSITDKTGKISYWIKGRKNNKMRLWESYFFAWVVFYLAISPKDKL